MTHPSSEGEEEPAPELCPGAPGGAHLQGAKLVSLAWCRWPSMQEADASRMNSQRHRVLKSLKNQMPNLV